MARPGPDAVYVRAFRAVPGVCKVHRATSRPLARRCRAGLYSKTAPRGLDLSCRLLFRPRLTWLTKDDGFAWLILTSPPHSS